MANQIIKDLSSTPPGKSDFLFTEDVNDYVLEVGEVIEYNGKDLRIVQRKKKFISSASPTFIYDADQIKPVAALVDVLQSLVDQLEAYV